MLLTFSLLLLFISWRTYGDPHLVIGEPSRPYLLRWYITPWSDEQLRTRMPVWLGNLARRLPNLYLHRILRSDDDRALHDHPWWNVSIILKGCYTEVVPVNSWQHEFYDFMPYGTIPLRRRAGQVVWRKAVDPHRLVVNAGPVWTLFMTGPKVREWGFRCPKGWKHWKDFTDPNAPQQIGPGCGEP